jgi:hypothetical protein
MCPKKRTTQQHGERFCDLGHKVGAKLPPEILNVLLPYSDISKKQNVTNLCDEQTSASRLAVLPSIFHPCSVIAKA